MIVTMLWIELCIELCVSGGLALWLLRHSDVGGWALLSPAAVFVTVRAGLVACSCVYAWRRSERPESLASPVRIKLFFWETIALLRFCLLMLSEPWHGKPERMPARTPAANRTVVVLLHGVYCNRGIWRPLVRRINRLTGITALAPNLAPVSADLETQAKHFAHWLDDAVLSMGGRVVIVGHSMGGLIARICIARAMAKTQIQTLICLGVPHAGSALARMIPGEVGRDLRLRSEILSTLHTAAPRANVELINVYSNDDNLVVPAGSARLEPARNWVLGGVGHMSLVYSPRVWTIVLRELQLP